MTNDAKLYSERETRSMQNMRSEFGRLTTIVGKRITHTPEFTDRNGNVWILHEGGQGLSYYYNKEHNT